MSTELGRREACWDPVGANNRKERKKVGQKLHMARNMDPYIQRKKSVGPLYGRILAKGFDTLSM